MTFEIYRGASYESSVGDLMDVGLDLHVRNYIVELEEAGPTELKGLRLVLETAS